MKIVQMLKDGARELGVKLDEEQIELLQVYLEELKRWNKVINLTSIAADERIVSTHFLDSISCLKSERIKPKARIVDLGAGAGFPGLPIKIVWPALQLTLVDSSKKKTDFLRFLVKKLRLKGAEVVCQRAEDFARESSNRESYDIVVARAVSSLPVLAEISLPLLKVGGALIAQKGKEITEELEQGAKAAAILGGEIEKAQRVDIPFLDSVRHLIIIGKVSATALKYPRRTGVPRKRPLGRH